MFHPLVRLSLTIGGAAVLLLAEKCGGDPQPRPKFGPSGKKTSLCTAGAMSVYFGCCLLHCRSGLTLSNWLHAQLTILFQASTHFRASGHPPILTVLQFCEVLGVTAHHAKFVCGDCSSVSQFLSIVLELMYIAAINLMHFRCCNIHSKGSHTPDP